MFVCSFESCTQISCNLFMCLYLQEEAGSLLVDLSSSLNSLSLSHDGDDDGGVVQAAIPIVEAASNILNVSSNVRSNAFSAVSKYVFFLSPLQSDNVYYVIFRKRSQNFFSLG